MVETAVGLRLDVDLRSTTESGIATQTCGKRTHEVESQLGAVGHAIEIDLVVSGPADGFDVGGILGY
jgi:hypothetical protein